MIYILTTGKYNQLMIKETKLGKLLGLKIQIKLLFALLFVLILGVISLNQIIEDLPAPVRSDALGYYSYLPAVFVEQDLSFSFLVDEQKESFSDKNTFEPSFNAKQAEQRGFNFFEEQNLYQNKYPIGVAILLTPFFLLGHLTTILFGEAQTGFSFYYQYFSFVGGLFYLGIGLIFLFQTIKTLLNKNKELIALTSVFLILLATPLLNYGSFENIFSHVYSFSLISILLYLTLKLHNVLKYFKKDKSQKNYEFRRRLKFNFILIGLVSGLIISVRQSNVIFLVVPFIINYSALYQILINSFKRTSFSKIFSLVSIASLYLFPLLLSFSVQMLYWWYAYGSPFTYSYEGEGFSLENTHFSQSLFSPERGLFFWSPILFFSIMGFLAALMKRSANLWSGIFLILFVYLWIIVSTWSSWTFGWGFGHRMFVDLLPLFGVGLAFLIQYLVYSNMKFLIYSVGVIFFFLTALNLFQTAQYWSRILPADGPTWEEYKEVFLDAYLKPYWWR